MLDDRSARKASVGASRSGTEKGRRLALRGGDGIKEQKVQAHWQCRN